MANRIPEEKVSQVRNRADIVDIISEVVRLKKTGKNYLGLCPFHTEKTPSFTVSPDKQIFHCFGCGEGGNVFSFLMKYGKGSFPEVVRQVARRYGIDLPDRPLTPAQKKRLDQRDSMVRANQQALSFYRHCLRKSAAGREARQYLQDRGITDETIEAFALGFAPDGWRHLGDHLKKAGLAADMLQAAGLIVPNKQRSGHYDRFRNRLIFPIFDLGNRVAGFGGRVIGAGEPKYLNSPETPIYNKRRILYGLNHTRQACRRAGVIHIVEGYFDLITLFQHGIENAAATLGTALTEDHLRLIKGYAERAILVFDADAAGMKAAFRGSGLFLKAGVDARVMVLPDGQDPDSFVRQAGADPFRAAVEKAPGIVEFIIDTAVRRFGLSVEGKVKIIAEMQPLLVDIDDSVTRSLYIRELSERIGVDERAIQEKVRQSTGQMGREGRRPQTVPVNRKETIPVSPAFKLEKRIVAMLLQYPEMIPDVEESGIISRFSDARLKSIGQVAIAGRRDAPMDVSDLMENGGHPELKQTIAALAMGELDGWSRKDCLRLIAQYLKISDPDRHEIVARIKAAETAGDHEAVARLLQLKQQWVQNQKTETRGHMG